MTSCSSPVAPGDVIFGKYRVESILGQGGMGVVVAARHIELGELFAIKFLLPQAANAPQAVERFVREARASAKLKGEHVAKVHDVGRLPNGLPYMVMEHLAGQDLKNVIRERNPLPITDVVTYMLQACEAIAEAHAHGIVHRDVKPANMFLTWRINGTPCIKVLDFGISKQLEPSDPEQHGLTKTGMLLGSPYYMAPEQMLKTKEADTRSDIWSLGCVLYELLTGRVPFLADALTELVGKVLQEEPDLPSNHRKDIPPAIDTVVMRCLLKRKEQRFQTVNELMEALRQATASVASAPMVAAMAVPVPNAPAASTMVMASASSSALNAANTDDNAITIALSNSAPMLAGAAAPGNANTAPGWGATAGNEKLPTKRNNRKGMLIGAAVGIVVLGGGGVFLATKSSAPDIVEGATSASPANMAMTTTEVNPTAMATVHPSAATIPIEKSTEAAPEPATVRASLSTQVPSKTGKLATTKSPPKQETPVAPAPAPKSKPGWGE